MGRRELEPAKERILVTGGAGFIGSALVRSFVRKHDVFVLDKLTYAGNLENLPPEREGLLRFLRGAIEDRELVQETFSSFRPTKVYNLAAESHVDRSIANSEAFFESNIRGTYVLLETAREYFDKASSEVQQNFRYVQISTDEVFGELAREGAFNELSRYQPSSPYSASKAAADHLVRAWHRTYGLPTNVTFCTNNYGPRQHFEKLIPVVIRSCIEEKKIPIYGDGGNVRDWIHVDDHCRGLRLVLEYGVAGEDYGFSGDNELSNLAVARDICDVMDRIAPRKSGRSYLELIDFVEDRPGHDFRYAFDCGKSSRLLGFRREMSWRTGIETTVRWYLQNQERFIASLGWK